MGGSARGVDLDGLIDRIYEAALLPVAWPKALADLADLADAAFASLVTFDGSVLRWTGTPEAIALIDNYKSVETITPNSRIAAFPRKDHSGSSQTLICFRPTKLKKIHSILTFFGRADTAGW